VVHSVLFKVVAVAVVVVVVVAKVKIKGNIPAHHRGRVIRSGELTAVIPSIELPKMLH
jgi:hypothetical protein